MNKDFFIKRQKELDKLAYTGNDLGVNKIGENFSIKIWNPEAKEVKILIFNIEEQLEEEFSLKSQDGLWFISLGKEYENKLYQFKIKQKNGDETIALDPYAKSLAPFDWKGETKDMPKAIICDWKKTLDGIPNIKLESDLNNGVDPLIYELHIRDFTSLSNKEFKSRKGTFLAALESNIFDYVKELGMTHIQLLPIQSIYTNNDKDLKILNKGDGQGWSTNYNWGYDPANYFSINGWYSSKPSDPLARMIEFKLFVNEAHKKGIGIIMDVVYNHMMINSIMDNIIPNYYFRDFATVKPVDQYPLNSNSKMGQKLILDSLIYFAKHFNVDGFRFDLSTFIDKNTLELLSTELRKINPNIILHGEAWQFTDLSFGDSYTKGINTNENNFAYFNDTIRNSIKGSDIESGDKGLVQGDISKIEMFIKSIVGNINNYDFDFKFQNPNNMYESFANEPGLALQYAACHDGFTLWDKIISTTNKSFIESLEMYRQALIMQITSQGRQLILAGTELLQSKPIDISGQDWERSSSILNSENNLDSKNDKELKVCDNTYKTTDYVNGIKWEHLTIDEVRKYIYEFSKQLFHFRNTTNFFRMNSSQDIIQNLKFIEIKKDFISFSITKENKKIIVCHNFSSNDLSKDYLNEYQLIFSSKINNSREKINSNSSSIWMKKYINSF